MAGLIKADVISERFINEAKEAAKTKKPVQVVYLNGIFGELPNCDGIAEEILKPKEGGTYTKIVGCRYFFKGYPDQPSVFGMEQAKSNISVLPRLIVARSPFLSTAVLLELILRPKRFWHFANIFMDEIVKKTMKHCGLPFERHNELTREILRAMDIALVSEFFKTPDYKTEILSTVNPKRPQWFDLPAAIAKATGFFCLLLERDGAYRLRYQDGFENLDKEKAEKDPVGELCRVIGIIIDHEVVKPGEISNVANKFKLIRKAIRVLFFLKPGLKRLLKIFLTELNVEKIRLDESDWYFCLRRTTHNPRGKKLAERLEELKRIDGEMGHYYVQIDSKTGKVSVDIPIRPDGKPRS